MKLRIGVLADYASISLGNKLNIMGIFSTIMATSAPVVHPQMQVVAQFEFDSSEAGNKNVRLELVDGDGRQLLSISGEARIERSLDGSSSIFNQILSLNNIVFPRFGEYEFRILFDHMMEHCIPLRLVQVDVPPASE